MHSVSAIDFVQILVAVYSINYFDYLFMNHYLLCYYLIDLNNYHLLYIYFALDMYY